MPSATHEAASPARRTCLGLLGLTVAAMLPRAVFAQSFGFNPPQKPVEQRDLLDLTDEEMEEQFAKAVNSIGSKGAGWGAFDFPINFSNGSSDVSADIATKLVKVATAMNKQQFTGHRLLIEGHANATGSAELNLRLTRERAAKVRAILINRYGVAAHRLEARGLGFESPLRAYDPTDGRQRRANLSLLPPR